MKPVHVLCISLKLHLLQSSVGVGREVMIIVITDAIDDTISKREEDDNLQD